MRIAHLILVHKNPEQVARLIRNLQHPFFEFYIHVDKKVEITPFKNLIKGRNIHFIDNRSQIHWGDWGTIQATLNGFEVILPRGFDYINIISGQDFPIKSVNEIYQFFCNHKGQEFITCDHPGEKWDVSSRIEQYHFINWRIPGKFKLSKMATKILPKRLFPLDYQIVGRANWFALSDKAAEYAVDFLKKNSAVVRYFKYCWGSDEFIFSTILYNSIFRSKIQDNLTHVDFNSGELGHPRVLTSTDLVDLKVSVKLFARKFDLETSPQIIELLEEQTI